MANEQNLIPNSKRSPSEVRENGAKGGRKSGESRRKKSNLKKAVETLLEMQTTDNFKKAFKKQGIDQVENLTNEQAIALTMTLKAISGDTRMLSLLMDITGEKQSDKLRLKELELKEKQANDMKSEALSKLDSILGEIRNNAFDSETE